MEYSFLQLMDLPNELLMNIFMELGNVPELFSFMGINRRLDNILQDSNFTNRLTLLKCASNDLICPLSDTIVNRFCFQILPKIHDKVKWINLEPLSLERILLAVDYPSLSGLGLYGIEDETAEYIFTNQILLDRIYKNQIRNLIITIGKNKKGQLTEYAITTVYTQIFTIFTDLRYLNFYSSSNIYDPRLSFEGTCPQFFSLTLMELHISLKSLNDCLYLLDGRFNQLRILYVKVISSFPPSTTINNKKILSNLKCFSLTCDLEMNFYDELLIPLLHRMSNLESLTLYVTVNIFDRFIDGNDLKKNILNHMPRLNKFIFNIRSLIILQNQIILPSKEDIQRTLIDFTNNQTISCVDYFRKKKSGQCHIYSYPYTLKYYNGITNHFPDGLFKCVREISLFDEQPFEYEFFIRIAQTFPLIQKLCLTNRKSQKNKQYQESKDNTENLSIIKYSHLIELQLTDVHKDYVELFLDHTKMCLPNNISLSINYRPLRKATHNFKRDALRINSAKINQLWIYENFKRSRRFQNYFPQVKKLSFLPLSQ